MGFIGSWHVSCRVLRNPKFKCRFISNLVRFSLISVCFLVFFSPITGNLPWGSFYGHVDGCEKLKTRMWNLLIKVFDDFMFVLKHEDFFTFEDFIFGLEDFSEGLFWCILDAVDFLAEEGIALYLVVASAFEDYIRFLFCHFRALLSFDIRYIQK